MRTAAPSRSGFSLRELLTAALVVAAVLALGVPALITAERRAMVDRAMGELVAVHQACMAMQRELAARGDPGVVALRIRDAATHPAVEVSISPPGPIEPATWMGRTLPVPIDGDGLVTTVTSSSLLAWSYQPKTGFIDHLDPQTALTLTFTTSAKPTAIERQVALYPLGYAEAP